MAEARAFLSAEGGVAALIFALSLLPFALAAGAAVDMGRAYVVRSRLAYALDAAGLAVGSAPTTDADALQTILEDYFEANYPEERMGVPAVPVMELVGNEIHLSVSATLPTTLMNVIGIHELEVATSAVIVKETKGLEVAMVLDVTGSMLGSKLAALQNASHDFLDILFGEEEVNDKLKIGIVPFAAAVNIGTSMAGYVKDNPGSPNRFGTQGWRGCVEARAYPYDVEDSYVASNSAANGRWRAYAWPPHSTQNNWPAITSTKGPNKGCHVEKIQPLTSVKATLEGVIDSLVAEGNTNVPQGTVWGWYVLSPEEPFTEGGPYDDEEFSKAIVIMTDGENTISTTTGTYSAYGTVTQATTKLGCSSQSCKEDEMNDRFIEVCDNIKAENILVYTIGFDLSPGSTALALLEDCASDPSKFFDSPTEEALQAAFHQIGTELSNLRIGQ
jgi:Flp pilus assembly protein TadG